MNEFEKKKMENIPYALALRSLTYAQVCTHLHIAYVTGMLGLYLSNQGLEHWRAIKRFYDIYRGQRNTYV